MFSLTNSVFTKNRCLNVSNTYKYGMHYIIFHFVGAIIIIILKYYGISDSFWIQMIIIWNHRQSVRLYFLYWSHVHWDDSRQININIWNSAMIYTISYSVLFDSKRKAKIRKKQQQQQNENNGIQLYSFQN